MFVTNALRLLDVVMSKVNAMLPLMGMQTLTGTAGRAVLPGHTQPKADRKT